MFACLWVFFVCNFVLFVFAMGRVAWNKPVMIHSCDDRKVKNCADDINIFLKLNYFVAN